MIVTLNVRLEGGEHPYIVTESGDPEMLMHWLSGFLAGNLIVDSMKVMK
jgi:hypothetical protein